MSAFKSCHGILRYVCVRYSHIQQRILAIARRIALYVNGPICSMPIFITALLDDQIKTTANIPISKKYLRIHLKFSKIKISFHFIILNIKFKIVNVYLYWHKILMILFLLYSVQLYCQQYFLKTYNKSSLSFLIVISA